MITVNDNTERSINAALLSIKTDMDNLRRLLKKNGVVYDFNSPLVEKDGVVTLDTTGTWEGKAVKDGDGNIITSTYPVINDSNTASTTSVLSAKKTTDLIEELYYQPGEVVQVHIWTSGFLTTSNKEIFFALPINKLLDNITSANLEVTKAAIGIEGTTTQTSLSVSSTTVSLKRNGSYLPYLYCRIINTSALSINNNTPVGLYCDGTITFS